MTTLSSRAIATIVASLILTGSALAQTAATPTPSAQSTTTKAATAEKKSAAPRSAISLECSKQADAKGLHGKERKKFRSQCKKSAAKPN